MGMRKVTMWTSNGDRNERIVSDEEARRLGNESARPESNILQFKDQPADPNQPADESDQW